MRLMMYWDEGDKETPIEFANAIIRVYMDQAEIFGREEDIIAAHNSLAEIADHIRVYLVHNKPVWNTGGRCAEE